MTKSPKAIAAELDRLEKNATPGPGKKAWNGGERPTLSEQIKYVTEMLGDVRVMVNRGNGDVTDEPDPTCAEATAYLLVIADQLAEKEHFYRNHHASILAALEDAGEVEGLRKALQPFADACAKADASSEEVRRAGMGNGHSDEATPGWGIRYKHLKEARRALGSAK